ncbi:cytochrome c biogenesis CcdA family protein [Actinophytocola gossypii]|uniref:Cytochrome c biogenesis protein CcdA n=1 Tax=Actinophytocola gossypii TaxID=2812003 RepID=A0ABT2JFW6_9PSEU|nr:cytochrome c biogenesis protein CcdA [Actinophytocola gossypii]MCT2586767.1 cytochrome c biogenesis protein CcdA [Actinophytocola gossypii]
MTGDLAFALGAGMLATVNPCGFAMLPGYLALVVGSRGVGRALAAAGLMTLGFVAVFGVFGLIGAPLAGALQRWLPVVTIVVGAGLVVFGALLVAGREPRVLVPKLKRGAPNTRLVSMVGYGVAFAVASLSCSIGPFLAAAGVALRSGAVLTFGAYALGMGLVVAVLAVGAALASTAAVAGLRRAMPYVTRAGGALLVVTGVYVGYYGYYELRLFHLGGSASDPVVRAAGSVQATLVSWLDAVGAVPLVIALVVLTGGVWVVRRRWSTAHRRRVGSEPDRAAAEQQ